MTGWARACLAIRLLAVDPGLGGAVIRARVGPARDALTAYAAQLPGTHVRLHPAMTVDTLDDGIDLTATLQSGQLIQKQGLLRQKRGVFSLTMAERCDSYLAARLAQVLDDDPRQIVLAMDEGAEDEGAPAALTSRLAFYLPLDEIALADLTPPPVLPSHGTLTAVDCRPEVAEQLVLLAAQFGIASLRAPGFALRCARAHAALREATTVAEEDVTAAVALTYAHLATQIPDESAAPPPEPDQPAHDSKRQEGVAIPDDILRDAVRAALPAGLLDRIQNGAKVPVTGSGSGQKKQGNRRGRPLPARAGGQRTHGRIDLLATLRAAVPWQTIRRQDRPGGPRAIIRPSDLRVKRYEDLSDRLLIFTVDASGSAAMARLGEAKGAVELLLAEAYARRDHVALIAFRGTGADVLLPPTRSLVQTKRRLAALPGGGGTPLAAGLQAAHQLALTARQKGLSPTVVLLTDGRSNVALDQSAHRVQAAEDVVRLSHVLARDRCDAIVIDTGKRPEKTLKQLAQTLSAPYIALPRADAQQLSKAVQTSLSV